LIKGTALEELSAAAAWPAGNVEATKTNPMTTTSLDEF
jgi:hypothetical protein